jgi:hypothetical protein
VVVDVGEDGDLQGRCYRRTLGECEVE